MFSRPPAGTVPVLTKYRHYPGFVPAEYRHCPGSFRSFLWKQAGMRDGRVLDHKGGRPVARWTLCYFADQQEGEVVLQTMEADLGG
jgi:hypothetical protein